MTTFSFPRWKRVSRSPRSRQTLGIAIVAILFIVWSVAGALKLANLAAFSDAVYALGIVPWNAVPFIAIYIPAVEIVVAIALVVPHWRLSALTVSGCMLFVFSVVMFLHRDSAHGCACFGGAVAMPPWMAIGRNFILLAANLYLWVVLMKDAYRNRESEVGLPVSHFSYVEHGRGHANEIK